MTRRRSEDEDIIPNLIAFIALFYITTYSAMTMIQYTYDVYMPTFTYGTLLPFAAALGLSLASYNARAPLFHSLLVILFSVLGLVLASLELTQYTNLGGGPTDLIPLLTLNASSSYRSLTATNSPNYTMNQLLWSLLLISTFICIALMANHFYGLLAYNKCTARWLGYRESPAYDPEPTKLDMRFNTTGDEENTFDPGPCMRDYLYCGVQDGENARCSQMLVLLQRAADLFAWLIVILTFFTSCFSLNWSSNPGAGLWPYCPSSGAFVIVLMAGFLTLQRRPSYANTRYCFQSRLLHVLDFTFELWGFVLVSIQWSTTYTMDNNSGNSVLPIRIANCYLQTSCYTTLAVNQGPFVSRSATVFVLPQPVGSSSFFATTTYTTRIFDLLFLTFSIGLTAAHLLHRLTLFWLLFQETNVNATDQPIKLKTPLYALSWFFGGGWCRSNRRNDDDDDNDEDEEE